MKKWIIILCLLFFVSTSHAGMKLIGGGLGGVTAAAPANGVVGNSSTASINYGGLSLGYWYHTDFVTTTAGNVSYAHAYITNDGDARTLCLGLFSSDGTLRLSASTEISHSGAAWVNIAIGSSYEIQDATTYYLAAQITPSSPGAFGYQSSGGNGMFYDSIGEYNCSAALNPEETQVDADGKYVIIFNNAAGDP